MSQHKTPMKTFISFGVMLAGMAVGHAQVFRPETVNGALLGGVAGAVIGNNSGDHNGARGAAIGALAGGLIGSTMAGPSSRPADVRVGIGVQSGGYVYRDGPAYHGGYRGGPHGRVGYHPGFRPAPVYYGSFGGGYAPGYYGSYVYDRPYVAGYPNYAANGLWLGALTGAIIGNNSGTFHHSAGRGALWGAGVGLLLGSVAEANRRAVVYESQPAVAAPPAAPAAAAPAAPVTIINNYYGTPPPMSSANSMFGR
jgi:hypothetical protein